MKLINDLIVNEIIINKSRFITHIFRVNNTDEVNMHLTNLKKKYYDANHNCYAYIIGDNQEIQKCSDDGEPSKTAGYPMLDVFKKQMLTNILAITTRYFGGIMLGAGGLVRAYSQSVSEALKQAIFYQKELLNIYKIVIDYSNYNLLIKSNLDFTVINTSFTSEVIIEIALKENKSSDILKSIDDLTNAKALVTFNGTKFIETLYSDI